MNNTASHIENFEARMDDGVFHLKTNHDHVTCCLCSWSIRNFSSFQNGTTEGFSLYSLKLSVNQEQVKIAFQMCDNLALNYNCSITISTDLGTVLFHKTVFPEIVFVPPEHTVYMTGEDFQKLKQLPNDAFILTCRIIRSGNEIIPMTSCNISVNNSEYLKSLQADLKQCSNASLKEKVKLCDGKETEIVNKAVLCVRSPVFAKMFGNDMRETKNNTITITDIKMPALRSLVSFLYSGVVQDCDFDFSCDLYYMAKKYQVFELHLVCIRLILSNVSLKNICKVLKLSILHNDELLKSAVMALISANFETVVLTSDWKNFMNEDPETGLMASNFFDFSTIKDDRFHGFHF